jgi:hypothetical protein
MRSVLPKCKPLQKTGLFHPTNFTRSCFLDTTTLDYAPSKEGPAVTLSLPVSRSVTLRHQVLIRLAFSARQSVHGYHSHPLVSRPVNRSADWALQLRVRGRALPFPQCDCPRSDRHPLERPALQRLLDLFAGIRLVLLEWRSHNLPLMSRPSPDLSAFRTRFSSFLAPPDFSRFLRNRLPLSLCQFLGPCPAAHEPRGASAFRPLPRGHLLIPQPV